MKKRTEWLELPEAIEFVGRAIFSEWTGRERRAPVPSELNAEIARLYELTPEQLAAEYDAWQAGIEAESTRERAVRESVGVKPSGIREGLEKLRVELAGETNEARRRALQRTIESLSQQAARLDETLKTQGQIEHDRGQFITDLLTARIEGAYQPGLAARKRWWEAHAAIDDAGRAGRMRARACRPALPPLPFDAERWRELFPRPGESRTVIDGIPAHIFLAKSDLEMAFAQTNPSSGEQRHEPQKAAKKSRKSHHPTRDRARQAMEKDIAEEKETMATIGQMTEQYRAERYGVSRETARLPLAELVARQIATSTG